MNGGGGKEWVDWGDNNSIQEISIINWLLDKLLFFFFLEKRKGIDRFFSIAINLKFDS